MIGKNNTASELDFLPLEEVSDEAAEVISGGQELVLGGVQEIAIDLAEVPLLPITLPIDIIGGLLDTLETAAGLPATFPMPEGFDPTTVLPLGIVEGIGIV
ncbi:hypothetical protein IQ238_16600 [Pleurocapsales cyanobacterium LEGE 06147]|nr:hypothetical protein [Pleurocapsales cyanobacterium LEGE 06147]